MATKIGNDVHSALTDFNKAYDKAWSFGTNWDNQGTEFETFVNKFLFPKINETALINVDLGNRFEWLAREVDFIGQYSEEYVIKDSVPVSLSLETNAYQMLEHNYPQMITKLYGNGIIKKQKFSLNNNDVRLNFATIGDAINYAMGVYLKRISDINYLEEQEVKGMLVDYAMNHSAYVDDSVQSLQELYSKLFELMLDLQDNNSIFNESKEASGGAIGRYTTTTKLDNVVILTTNRVKTYLLDTKIANTFNAEGIDLSKRIISFRDLGGVYRLTENVKVESDEALALFDAMGDYQTKKGHTIMKGMVISFDVSDLPEFKGKVVEIKPDTDNFTYVFDINKIRYEKYTKDMLKKPLFDRENDVYTHWMHYYSRKNMSPFYNGALIK